MLRHQLYFLPTLLAMVTHTVAIAGIRLRVVDIDSKTPIPQVQAMHINGKDTSVVASDTLGVVLLPAVMQGDVLLLRKLGYNDLFKRIRQSDITNKTAIDIFMQRKQFSIPEVVVTGQTTPTLANNSIYKVSTISATQIMQRGAVSLNDVLGFEMNNFISNDNVLGASSSIAGIGGQNVKILVNGIPLLGRENGNIDLTQINMNNVKRIETIQGPMSVFYGSNALGGVINLITNTPIKKTSITARTYLESIGRYNFSGSSSFIKDKHKVQLSFARNFFQGWTPPDSLDRFQVWKPKRQYTGDIQYFYTLQKLKLNYFGSFIHEKITNKGVPIVNPYEGYAFDEYYRTARVINAVNATLDVNKTDQLNLMNSYSVYNRTKNRFKKDLVNMKEIQTLSAGDQDTSTFKNINLRGTYTSSRIKHTQITGGYEYTHETGSSYKLENNKQKLSEIGLFSSALYTKGNLQIQPSARYTLNSRYKSAFTPALHIKYDFNANTWLRASYASGYRTPTLKEMYLQFIDQNHTILGNENLKPEVGQHAQAGIEKQFVINKTQLNVSATGYYNSIQNLIALAVYNKHAVLRQYANIEKYQNSVFNLQGKLRTEKLQASVGTGAIFVSASSLVPQHTIWEASCIGSYTFSPLATTLSVNYKYNSKQPIITIDNKFLYTSPLHIANVSLQRHFFNKYLLVQMGVKNLFNLQSTALSGDASSAAGGHLSPSGMQVFPARSIFFDITYSL